jgi:hypothetical protein
MSRPLPSGRTATATVSPNCGGITKEAETRIMWLLELVEKGVMHAEDAKLRDRLIGLKLRRDEVG